MIPQEVLQQAKRVLPSVSAIARITGVSRITVHSVFAGKSNNKTVVDYILTETANETAKRKSLTEKILKNAC